MSPRSDRHIRLTASFVAALAALVAALSATIVSAARARALAPSYAIHRQSAGSAGLSRAGRLAAGVALRTVRTGHPATAGAGGTSSAGSLAASSASRTMTGAGRGTSSAPGSTASSAGASTPGETAPTKTPSAPAKTVPAPTKITSGPTKIISGPTKTTPGPTKTTPTPTKTTPAPTKPTPAPPKPTAPTPTTPTTPTTPSTVTFYNDPSDSANVEERQLAASGDTADAAAIEQIADQPQGIWLTDDSSTSIVPSVMSAAAQQGTVPIFVLYDLPWRDCGQYSSGGASDPSDYESYINTVASDLGQGRADVIVEPDALSELSCLTGSEQSSYYQLIGYAAQQIDQDANASVYVDAGHPGWQSAATEASALQSALGSTRAGFALNTSNFHSTADDIAYGTAISQAAGGRHFVIDTSRNGGSVASGQWCNPSGAALGTNPTTDTGNPLVDALLWIKPPGESDGSCNGGPSAGQFWLSYAEGLVANR